MNSRSHDEIYRVRDDLYDVEQCLIACNYGLAFDLVNDVRKRLLDLTNPGKKTTTKEGETMSNAECTQILSVHGATLTQREDGNATLTGGTIVCTPLLNVDVVGVTVLSPEEAEEEGAAT